MSTQELGLLLGQLLFGADDLHYGLWEDDIPLNVSHLPQAQQRYTNLLLSQLPPLADGVCILDIGCGTGHLLSQLLSFGYHADGLVPSHVLAERVRKRLRERAVCPAQVFEQTFELFDGDKYRDHYQAAVFSESFQYIPLEYSLPMLMKIVKPGGTVIICDFFRSQHAGDCGPGDRSFSGGHRMDAFYEQLKKHAFSIVRDDDITEKISPNMTLVNQILMQKIVPAGHIFDKFLSDNHRFLYGPIKAVVKRLFRKKIRKAKYKYFSGNRSKEVFEHYKVYRLIVLTVDK